MTTKLPALKGEQLFFAKLSISNMSWSCRTPEEYQHSVGVRVAGSVYSFPSLPFGWIASPALPQQLLAVYLVRAFLGEVFLMQYMDDMLIMGSGE